MSVCETCKRPDVPPNHRLKQDPRREKEYCTCIKWDTFDECVRLSCENAEHLLDDAQLLLRNKRVTSGWILATYSEEELGKAVIAAEKWLRRSDLKYSEYQKFFRFGDAHELKIRAAGRLLYDPRVTVKLLEKFAEHKREGRERRLYVDYSFPSRRWLGPTSNLIAEMSSRMGDSYQESRDPLRMLEISLLEEEIETLRNRTKALKAFFEKHKDEHMPNAVLTNNPAEPEVRMPDKRFTPDDLRRLLNDWLDRQVELKNATIDIRNPLRTMDAAAEKGTRAIIDIAKGQSAPESQRYALAVALISLRADIYSNYETLIEDMEKRSDFSGAADLMNAFVTRFVIPIVRRKRLPRSLRRARNTIAEKKDAMPFDFILRWQDDCSAWRKLYRRKPMERGTRRRYIEMKGKYGDLLLARAF